ncbi:tetratricopeptide repeat-containing sensor histidine kinase [Mucilaginibacter sp. MD40]|uniref:ATP-binding protein n=1 Tax=Mucilaginibacter sp. MD40 TaxID=2029590 RepID=UPI00117C2011|nr:tetratricopeptide repeat-containing sensor histidine kinase [Mucilaginibacter sp. MD40]
MGKPPDEGVDSLKKLLNISAAPIRNSDTTTINRINELADHYYESMPDSSTYYAKVAVDLSKKSGYKKGEAAGNNILGRVNSFNGKYDEAQKNYNTALNIYTTLNNQLGISESYMGLGRVQDFLGNYDKAINYFHLALAIRKKLNNPLEIAHCYAIIGITYDNKGDFNKALDNYFHSLTIDLRLNNQLAAADNYCNIGVVMQHLELYAKALEYFNKANALWLKLDDKQGISTAYQNIGEVLLAQKQYDKALRYFKEAGAMYHELGDEEGIGLIYYNIGLYHFHTGRIDSALHYLNQAVSYSKKSRIPYNVVNAYIGLATVYNQQKDFLNAEKYALLARETADKLQSLNMRADAVLQLSIALAGLNNFREAYAQHNLYLRLQDSLKNDVSLQKLSSYNQMLDFEANQRKASLKEKYLMEKLAQQRRTNIVYGIIILVVTIMLIFYYNAKRKQFEANAQLAEKNKEVIEQAEKLNDLNHLKDRLIGILAHDLRAPLSTLRGVFSLLTSKDLTTDEFMAMVPKVFVKLEQTSDFLDTLLFWINSQVDNIEDTTVSFCLCDVVDEELNILDEQFRLKNITPVNNVNNEHTVLADPKSIRIVIHNLLTNAIKFSHCNSEIHIAATCLDNRIKFSVQDTGVGMNASQLKKLFAGKMVSQLGTLNERGTGMGMVFCKDLIEKYNGTIYAESEPGTGTTFSFILPAAK